MKKEIFGDDGLLRCATCGERTQKMVDFPTLAGGYEKTIVRCSCECDKQEKQRIEARFAEEEAQRQIAKLRKVSLMDEKMLNATFQNYIITDENRKAYGTAKNYVGRFDAMYDQGKGLLIWGNVGTGKSYMAAAIANSLLERQVPVVVTSFVKLLDKMIHDKEVDDYLWWLNQAKLLVLDDFGVERCTDYALEKVYDIIDSRYRSKKPLIMTTNIRLQDMQNCTDLKYNRIYDRVYEMCYPVRIDGMSWRKRTAAKQFDEMKKLLEGQ